MFEKDAALEILIVEDNDDDYEAIERALGQEQNLSLTLRRIDNGQEAWQDLTARVSEGATEGNAAGNAAQGKLPSLIILDLNMPGLDGRKLLQRLKDDARLRAVPVVIMTTSTEEAEVRACYQSGANTFVAKPLSYDEFLATVQRLRDYWFKAAVLSD